MTDRDFTGQKENSELGLLYYNARYYLPGIGRFVSADTIVPDPSQPQSFNRYSYVLNNPVKYSDPSGHCAEPVTFVLCTAAIGAGIGLIVDYGTQVDNNRDAGMPWSQAVYWKNIRWSQTAGATAAGGIGSAIATPFSSFLGAGGSLLRQLGTSALGGALGGAVGGQANGLVTATVQEAGDMLTGHGFNGNQLLIEAIAYGFLDQDTLMLDAATGTVFALGGEALNRVLHGVNPLKPWKGSEPTVPMVRYGPELGRGVGPTIYYSGREITLSLAQYEAFLTAIAQGTIDFATDLLSEWLSSIASDTLDN